MGIKITDCKSDRKSKTFSTNNTKKNVTKSKETKLNETDEFFLMGYDDCLMDCLLHMIEHENLKPADKEFKLIFNYLMNKRNQLLKSNL
jgi:hypothetical protein